MSLILLAILPVLLLLGYSDLDDIGVVDQTLVEDAKRFAGLAALRQRTLIAVAQKILVTVSSVSEVRSLDANRCGDLLAEMARQHFEFANLGVVDLNGRLRCSAVPFDRNLNLSGQRYVREALARNGLSSGQFVMDRATKNATLNYGYPVKEDDRVVGVAFVAIDLRSLNDFADQALLPDGARLYLLDPTNIILRVAPEHRELIGLSIRSVFPNLSPGSNGTFHLTDSAGDRVVVARQPVDSLIAACVLPQNAPLNQAKRKAFIDLSGSLLVALISFRIAWIVAGGRLVKPVEALVKATERVNDGDLDTRIGGAWKGELGTLSNAFDQMTAVLLERRETLIRNQRSIEEQTNRLRALHLLDLEILSGAAPELAIQAVLPHLKQFIDAERVSLILVDGETATLIWVESDPSLGPCTLGPLKSEDFASFDRLRLEPFYAPDLSAGTDLPLSLRRARDRGVRTLLVVPLVADTKLTGWLSLSSRSEDAFPDSGQQVAKEVASQLAIAVQQAGLRTTLVRERKWLQTIVRHLPEGVALLAADGRVLFANPAGQKALAMFGHDPTEPLREIQGRTIQQLEQRSAAGNWTDLVVEKPERRELDVFVTHANSGADQTVIVIRDTTVERDVRRQLNRQERLAGVGQMASGISHDFNNLLFAIMANAEVLARDGTASPQVVTRATSITEMARRGGRIIRQILDFSRKSISAREPLDIGHFVNESLPLIRHAVPQSIALDFDKPTGKLMVLADPARVEQMLTNLIVNARDAMPKGGNITVSLARTMTTNTKTNRPGQWISLQVRDTGGGIPAELQKRVFEPYFTTKGLDQGTGLGLAQVLGIVQDHGGQIALQSDSTGTTFTILLPAITVAPLAASAQDSEPLPSGSGELVLLVEDDENVREPVRDNLELLGYRVIAATNGVDALSLFADHAAEVRVVLTDAVMPRMGGIELLRVIRDRNPSVGTILMSGTPDAISEAMTSGTPFLEKPFALSLLARTIRDVLVG